ncbi:MAG: Flp pilus assembly protein CpaB, partial [Parvularculaceae bacterium]|nr:Flp pilus assembly protein CpaB [Parvularculaceae bacterium]
MNVTRIAILGVALVAGGGAFLLMMTNSPKPQQAVQVVAPAAEKTARVLVAARDFQRGERFTAEDTKYVDWPERALSPAFLTQAGGATQESVVGAVARTALVSGEPLTETKIVRAGSAGLMAAVLTPGMRAVSMRIAPETGVAGFILPGDKVDVYYSEPDAGGFTQTTVLLEDVRVLAINTVYAEASETPTIEGVNATVELSPDDAQRFVNARASKGQLSFALRSIFKADGDAKPET